MGILKKDVGQYNKKTEEEPNDDIGTDHRLGSLKSKLKGLTGDPNIVDLSLSVRSDDFSGSIIADSISAWPIAERTRDINSRVVVPLPHSGSKEDMMSATEHARRYIANAIAEQMIAAGVIRFAEHREFDSYFGDERLVVEGTVSVPY